MSLIHIFLPGGMAHQESWDPKPLAPIEYRGPLGTVDTKIPGIKFSQNLAQTAQIADKLTIVRGMTHGEAAHERGTHNMFTGYRPSPALSYPSFGSVISHEFGPRKNLPPYVCVPSMPNEFAGSGYLSSAYGPFSLGSDPADANFQVKDLVLPGGMSTERFAKSKTMLQSVDAHFRTLEKSDALDAMDTFYQRAYGLLSSAEAREAFNMKAEPDAIKDAYGRNPAGMRMLLARRLACGTRWQRKGRRVGSPLLLSSAIRSHHLGALSRSSCANPADAFQGPECRSPSASIAHCLPPSPSVGTDSRRPS